MFSNHEIDNFNKCFTLFTKKITKLFLVFFHQSILCWWVLHPQFLYLGLKFSSKMNRLCVGLAYFFILENSSQILKIKLSNIENSQGTSSSKANLILLRTEFSTRRSILEATISICSSFQIWGTYIQKNCVPYMGDKMFLNKEK